MVESSIPQKRSRPDTETPVEVKLELGVGALYTAISWSERISQSLEAGDYTNKLKKIPYLKLDLLKGHKICPK